MDFESVLQAEHAPLTRRLRRMVGSGELAEDLRQEAFARACESGPHGASPDVLRAWLHRVASNLAIDALRRAARHPVAPLDEFLAAAPGADPGDALAAREALDRIRPHDRLLLLLRFEAGLTYSEIAQLLDVSAQAARQRLARARRAFADAYRQAPLERPPRVYVLFGDDEPEPYVRWLESAGAEVRPLPREDFERGLALADGVVVGGKRADVDPVVYGETPRTDLFEPDAGHDRRDMAVIRAALEQDVPLVGICRGHQLLNIVLGGSLHQDLVGDRVAARHPERHVVHNAAGSVARRVLGRTADVSSRHHQAIKRLGGGLRVVSTSDDGLVEAIELRRRRFAVGVQFHPEDRLGESDRRLADAFVATAARRAA